MSDNSQKEPRKDNRKHIQDVAIELFKEYGYEETSITMICEKAGISKTTLHYYFPKKEDLYSDMMNSYEDEYKEKYVRVFECETFTKQIWEIFLILFEGDLYYGADTKRQYFQLRLKTHSQRDFAQNAYYRKMLIPIIRSAQHSGQMLNNSDPECICDTLSYLIRGIGITWAIEDNSLDLIQAAKNMIRAIILPAEGFDI